MKNDAYLIQYADAGLYTMLGRLSAPENGRFQSFPRQSWRREIELASTVPLRGFEWIYDLYGCGANPIETTEGRRDWAQTLQAHGVHVVSICADYFMDCPLVRVVTDVLDERVRRLQRLIALGPELGVKRIVLPFVDTSKMIDVTDHECVLRVLHEMLPHAENAGVELHLEADLSPAEFRAFLNEIRSPWIRVNYDAGNSAALGYAPKEEFTAYGDRIGSFHIKDRKLGGGTVPLGTGDADFSSLRAALIDVEYRGDFVLQIARGTAGTEVDWLSAGAATACRWLRGEHNL